MQDCNMQGWMEHATSDTENTYSQKITINKSTTENHDFHSNFKSIIYNPYTEDTSLASLGVCCGLRTIWISGRGDADSEEITEKMMRAWEVNVHMVREPPILCQHRLNSDAKTKSMTNKPEVWRLISASMGGWGVINTFQGPVNDKGFAMEFRRSSTTIDYHKTSVF